MGQVFPSDLFAQTLVSARLAVITFRRNQAYPERFVNTTPPRLETPGSYGLPKVIPIVNPCKTTAISSALHTHELPSDDIRGDYERLGFTNLVEKS